MRKIRILCVGRKQETYLKSGIEIYRKKLKRYCEFELKTIREADYSRGMQAQWLNKEYQAIQTQLRPNTFLIACDETGISLSSVDFARQLEQITNQGQSKIDFIIGGPYGLPPEIKNQANLLFRLSAMTLTHQMVRLFLVEQIYRAFTILNGEKYHH
ncbi:23S rRNA (pseudouridine(1915)-N(3))-methyltransferase RlmH [bacterium]|nr:23S rRNA (pseudouridine(1915)-N(3))-methyltransferase RlmH [bacterium]